MSILNPSTSGFLFTDFYQLTMAQVYFEHNIQEKRAHFDYFFRHYPHYGSHQAGYCVFAGLKTFFEWLNKAKPTREDISYLKSLRGRNKQPLFSSSFLNWLEKECDFSKLHIEAIPEGRVVHPQVPLVSISGPLALAQIVETPLLNHLNYQTLIATKASRIKEAARGQMVIDFGMRRAHGLGANAGTRGALIGGVDFSSNIGTSRALNLPPKGTHAHSLVQAFMAMGGSELDAFQAFAEIFPDDCILLIDTINTLESGLPNAIKVFQDLKKKGHTPLGIRIDSGDLAYLSVQCYLELKKAGLQEVSIVLSNQLDELVIQQILNQIEQECKEHRLDAEEVISKLVFGVGTRMLTSEGQPSLDGVYKLTGIYHQEKWQPALKISNSPAKIINPGHKKTFRLYDKRDKAMVDLICLKEEELFSQEDMQIHHPTDPNISRIIHQKEVKKIEALQTTIQTQGKVIYEFPELNTIKQVRQQDLQNLDSGVKRLINPHIYHVSLSPKLFKLKMDLLKKYQPPRQTLDRELGFE